MSAGRDGQQNEDQQLAEVFRGAVEHQLHGQHEEALRSYDEVLCLNPTLAAAHFNRGFVLQQLGRIDEAIRSYDEATRIEPHDADAYYIQGTALKFLSRFDQALHSFNQAIHLKPDHVAAHVNRGIVLADLNRHQEALQSFEQVITLQPDFAEVWHNRGEALLKLQRPHDALQSFDRVIRLRPDLAEAHYERGNALHELRRAQDAIRSYDRARELNSDLGIAALAKGVSLLQMGNFEEGWPLYEWRKRTRASSGYREFAQPMWSGTESLEGKTLFIYAEQGLGDTIHFCRYAQLAQEKGARVIFAVPDQLVRLLKDLSLGIDVIRMSSQSPDFDYYIELQSMPLAFRTNLANCPSQVPYLRAEPDRVGYWRDRLGDHGFKIGISWQGNKNAEVDIGRSFPLRNFEGLAKLPGVRLISLQKNEGAEQLLELPPGIRIETLGEDFDAPPHAFVDTAAVTETLDLVITSDTAIAHLAGALGRPAWVALKYVPDWRWLFDRSDTPWYPTVQLFTQKIRGDWASVFTAMVSQLAAMRQAQIGEKISH